MTQFKLIPYNFRIVKIGTSDPVQLGNLDGSNIEPPQDQRPQNNHGQQVIDTDPIDENNDVLNLIQLYLTEHRNTSILNEDKKTLAIERNDLEGREIYGITKSGEFGLGADFFNIVNRQERIGARTENDSEVYPFFFHFHIPNDLYEGKLILQTFSVHGTQLLLEKTMNDFLDQYGYSIVFTRLISQNLLDQIEESRMVELQLIKKRVRSDVAEAVYEGPCEDITEIRSYKIKRKGIFHLPPELRTALQIRSNDYFEILDEQWDEVKAIVTRSGSHITLTFGRESDKFRESLILPQEIRLQNGHPRFEDVKTHSIEYMNHILQRVGEIPVE
jgi:hypothetical protein